VGNLLGMPTLTGPFLFTIAAQLSATSVFWFGLRPDPLLTAQQLEVDRGNRPKVSLKSAMVTLRRHPLASYAMASIALSHMVMVSVMSMTPVHMTSHGATLVLVGFTISLHIAGMYAFAPIFGILSDKLGRVKTVIIGQLILIIALAFAGLGSEDHTLVAIGLFLLGLGWSAATVAGSTLLATSLPAEEKANVQGVSDSLMSLAGALGGAVAGTILAAFAFVGLNVSALIPVSLVLILTALRRSRG
jgi:MFS family permease